MNKYKVGPLESFASGSNKYRIRRVQEIVDGKIVAIVMAIITIWVLFGDDIRLLATSKPADTGFFASFFLCLLLFIIEIIANSIFIQDYKFTFFFWLDVVATISLIPDIPMIRDAFLGLFGVKLYSVSIDYDTSAIRNTLAQSYTTRAIQTIRYIRLVRIVKLYKYFTKKRVEDPSTKTVANTNMDAEILGKKLSDITTRRVIIGVLSLLLLLPLLQVETVDNAKYYGLQELYWVGSSKDSSDLMSTGYVQYMNANGWNDMVLRYAMNSETTEGAGAKYPLLWLRSPDLMAGGTVQDIVNATDPITGRSWNSDTSCSGMVPSSDCNYRDEEMEIVVYGPVVCYFVGCEQVKAFARYNVKDYVQSQAEMSIIITIFVGIILAAASITFARDTQSIVIKPVNKMISIIRNLAKDPLKVGSTGPKSSTRGSILEETIDKIGILLSINFGVRGSQIMNELLAEPEINFKIEGRKGTFVILIVTIKDSAMIIDSLQEEVLVFINKIAKIVHNCAVRWGGSICRNDMGSFLMIWPEEQANEALFAAVKIYAELHRANDIMAYKLNPKIVTGIKENYMVDIQMALNIGEIIEGPIGSNIKVMPDFINPSISTTMKLQALNQLYATNLIMTDMFYEILDSKAQQICRKIDSIMLRNSSSQHDIYTFELSEVSLPDFKRMNMNDDEFSIEDRKPGDPIVLGLANIECEAYQLFEIDNDVLGMLKAVPNYFNGMFANSLELYKKGNWQEALQIIEQAVGLRPGDGPSFSLKKFIESYAGKLPENWPGYRIVG